MVKGASRLLAGSVSEIVSSGKAPVGMLMARPGLTAPMVGGTLVTLTTKLLETATRLFLSMASVGPYDAPVQE